MDEYIFPTLVGKDIRGNTKIWMGRVWSQGPLAYSEIQFGRQNGKLQTTQVVYSAGKNIGKENETTPYRQCLAETERKWKNQKKKQYVELESEPFFPSEPTERIPARILPMLAKTWTFPQVPAPPKKSDIVFPCLVQPKLDGLRCLMYMENGRIICQSRAGGEFVGLDHLENEVRLVVEEHSSWVLDGELYTDAISFETLAGAIKRKTHTDAQREQLRQVEYHIYDIYDRNYMDAPCEERIQWLHAFAGVSHVRPVETCPAHSPEEVLTHFHRFIEHGHEGIILRNTRGPYVPNHRSHHLQKYKEFMEEEYPIVGFTSGVGKYAGCVIWICRYSPDGNVFHVIPRGTVEQKRQWFVDGDQYIGKPLTVIFQQKMESGCPRFPIGKAVREGY